MNEVPDEDTSVRRRYGPYSFLVPFRVFLVANPCESAAARAD
jgi:hypothetical protein